MFDIGFFELVLLGVVGLLVLGPERLPHAVRMTTAYIGKIRRAVSSVREEFEREVNMHEMQQRIKQQLDESGLDEAQKSLQELKQQVEGTPSPWQPGNQIGGNLAGTADDDPDTRHNPTAPENEAEPIPEPEPSAELNSGDEPAPDVAPKQESPKA
ncbi:MAG: Sec-independent protein translocase protein TatB [Pseudomonadota bacterium]|nr:Sec-independent protein translocase protein TatB [Pseudomonadota bacterium]